MPIRVKRASLNRPPDTRDEGPEFNDVPFENRTTTYDGQTFHWGMNEKRSFADDGVGAGHTRATGGATIVEDNFPFTGRS